MAQHQVGSQHDESHLLATMANMKAFGFTFAEFDQWAADAGCTCNREPRWQQPPASNQSDRPGRSIINLAAKHYGYEKPQPSQPIPNDEPGANPQLVPHRWFEIGQWIAERILIADFAYVPKRTTSLPGGSGSAVAGGASSAPIVTPSPTGYTPASSR